MAELPHDVEQVLIGSLIGDGGLTKSKSVRYYEAHSIKQVEYLKWKAGILSLCFEGNIAIRKEKNNHLAVVFSTHSHPLFNELRKTWYPNGRKIIPMQELQKLDKLGLAVWYQDDGYYNYEKRMCGIALGKKFESQEDTLKDWFMEKWGLDSYIATRIKNPCLHFLVKDSDKFLTMIKRHVHPSLIYKLGHLSDANRSKLESTRKKYLEQNRQRYYNQREERARLGKQYYQNHRKERLQYAHRLLIATRYYSRYFPDARPELGKKREG